MGRRDYAHVVLTCHKGINEQRDKASQDECATALNVWAPDGKIEQRPGFEGVSWIRNGSSQSGGDNQFFLKEVSGGTVTAADVTESLSLNSLAVGDYWYVGFPNVVPSAFTDQKIAGVRIAISSTNSNDTEFKSEYWNGTEWKYLPVKESSTVDGVQTTPHLGDADTWFTWPTPGDWTSKTISATGDGSRSGYWVRFTILKTALDGSTTINNAAGTQKLVGSSTCRIAGFFSSQFPSVRRYTALHVDGSFSRRYTQGKDLLLRSPIVSANTASDTGVKTASEQALATHAAVPDFGEGYIAYGGEVTYYRSDEDWNPSVVSSRLAEVEDGEWAIGENAPFDPTLISALSSFPRAKYISFFKNRLWVAGLDGEPYTVRWSAGGLYRKVWPSLSYEPVIEDDNSPITGMAPLGEHMVVFKQDSIWMMVNIGENPRTKVQHYDPVRVVAGVGCVSHSSIQQVRGSLIFLAEDGVYAFDGTPNIQKLSDKITNTIDSIVPTRREFATSVNWKSKSCYLLSVPTDGEWNNNKTLVFDYKNAAWWVWDVPACVWAKDEDQYDEERIHFIDRRGNMYRLGVGNTDHGAAIISSLTTQRINEGANTRPTLRQVEVTSTNLSGTLYVQVQANDDEAGAVGGNLVVSDASDAAYGSAVHNVDKYATERYRARRLGFRVQGDWVQASVTNTLKNEPMSVRSVDLGFLRGPRR